ncbi:MAG: GIY-YIG nuclease family protein [Chryseosolibacter sp.]
MEHYIYVLFSPNYDQTYIGFSDNVEARFRSHNEHAKKGWTIRYRPWTIVHQESYPTKKQALAREKQLKSAKGREWIRKSILGQ